MKVQTVIIAKKLHLTHLVITLLNGPGTQMVVNNRSAKCWGLENIAKDHSSGISSVQMPQQNISHWYFTFEHKSKIIMWPRFIKKKKKIFHIATRRVVILSIRFLKWREEIPGKF